MISKRSFLAAAAAAGLSVLALTLAPLVASTPAVAQGKGLTVFAAASMKNALDDANTAFTKETGISVTASYAASSALMRQIEQGAPADVFVSADLRWMDHGIENKLINAESRVNLLGNKLVLIAPADSKIGTVEIKEGLDLATLLDGGRLVTGDVKAVPVGRYAQAALTKLGLWETAEPRMAMVENVRAALALVARGEAPLGIVYETDAKVEPSVKIVGTFPDGSHEPIIYPVGATAASKSDATGRYLEFLRSPEATKIFEGYGFTALAKTAS